MKAAVYIRVSKPEQAEGYSLKAQRRACRNYARDRDWTIVEEYEEPGFSAKTDQRPEFQRMITDAETGRFDVILVHKLDRFARSAMDVLRYAKLFQELDITWVCIAEQFDFTTPSGKLLMTMLAALAEWFLNNLSKEVKKGKRERVLQGLWNGDPPWGTCRGLCKTCKEPNGQGYCPNFGGPNVGDGEHLIHHPVDSQGVLLAFQLHASGEYSDGDVAEALNEAGYRTSRKWSKDKTKGGPGPFSKHTVNWILNNRFYTGLVQYKGEWFPGAHDALIGQELWDRSQTVRRILHKAPRSKKRKTRIYPLSGLLYCARCEGKMWGQPTPRGYYYMDSTRYQKRDCTQPMVKAEEIEDTVSALVKRITLPEERRVSVQSLLDQAGEEKEEREKQRGLLEARLERLKHLYLDGDILDPEYSRERDAIKRELAKLTITDQAIVEASETLDNFPLIWEEATPVERKELLHMLFKRIYIRDKKIVTIIPRLPFFPFFAGTSKATTMA